MVIFILGDEGSQNFPEVWAQSVSNSHIEKTPITTLGGLSVKGALRTVSSYRDPVRRR